MEGQTVHDGIGRVMHSIVWQKTFVLRLVWS